MDRFSSSARTRVSRSARRPGRTGFIDRGWKRKCEKQVLAHTIAYRDGSGVPYQESRSLTYWA